jgi:hypothetical protein
MTNKYLKRTKLSPGSINFLFQLNNKKVILRYNEKPTRYVFLLNMIVMGEVAVVLLVVKELNAGTQIIKQTWSMVYGFSYCYNL